MFEDLQVIGFDRLLISYHYAPVTVRLPGKGGMGTLGDSDNDLTDHTRDSDRSD